MESDQQLPDKCKFCGLCVTYQDSFAALLTETSIDNDFPQLHRLKKEGIIDKVPLRYSKVVLGNELKNTTSFCAISASAWQNPRQACEHWTLKIQGASIADYLAIHHSNRNNTLAIWISVLALFLTIVVAIVD